MFGGSGAGADRNQKQSSFGFGSLWELVVRTNTSAPLLRKNPGNQKIIFKSGLIMFH
jgi:hypothetical protein